MQSRRTDGQRWRRGHGSLLIPVVAIAAFSALALAGPSVALADVTLYGRVWQDLNGNGQIDSGEPAVARQRLLLSGPEGASGSTETDAGGEYSFTSLKAGTYIVQIEGDAGQAWVATHPARIFQGTIRANVDVSATAAANLDFGLFPLDRTARFRGTATTELSTLTNPLVSASINGRDCSFSSGLRPSDAGPSFFSIAVASATLIEGCGRPGDTVTFMVNGIPANETASWQAGVTSQITLTAERTGLKHEVARVLSGADGRLVANGSVILLRRLVNTAGVGRGENAVFENCGEVVVQGGTAEFVPLITAACPEGSEMAPAVRLPGGTIDVPAVASPTIQWRHSKSGEAPLRIEMVTIRIPVDGPGIRPPDTGDGGLLK